MKDGYKRNINYMRLSVTDKCNYRCKYCMPDRCSFKNDMLSFDELYDICVATVSCGVTKIRITGGEPLIRDGVLDFCKRLSALDKVEELTMTTNGSLLKQYAPKLKSAGINRLNVSLDTLKPDKFKQITGVDDLDGVLEGLQETTRCGFKNTKINVVLMEGINTDEIADFVELTKHNDFCVRFIELMPIGNNVFNSSHFVSADTVLCTVPELKRIDMDGVAQTYKIDGYKGTVGLIRPITNKFCDECNRIRVTSDGKLKVCLHSDNEYDLCNLSIDDMIATIGTAINNKPFSHKLDSAHCSSTLRNMYEIGG